MQDQTGYAAIAFFMAIWWAIVTYFVVRAEPSKMRTYMLAVAGFTALCVIAQVAAILAKWNVLGDVATFVATIAGCAALVGGVTYYIRNRPQQFDTEPVEAKATQQNFVTPGVYASAVPALKRRGRI